MTRAAALAAMAADLARFKYDPLGFVLWAFEWGVIGNDLEKEDGPDDWQRSVLEDIGDSLTLNPFQVIRDATASGHGIGKSALVAWLVLWVTCCWIDARGNVTANTDGQLKTKTWPEVTKWFNRLNPLLRQQFKITATAIYSLAPNRERNWRVDAVPWSKANPAAFAGLHNAGKIVLLIMDEGSEIDDMIYEVTEGATTDKDTTIIWLVFGNPTRNTGRFKEIVSGRFGKLWNPRRIDSRRVVRTNKETLKDWENSYGEDSDFFRVRVKGMFPRASSMQFIPEDIVTAARARDPGYIASDPIIWGLDVARHGDDSSVLAKRRGRDAKNQEWKRWSIPDLMQLAAMVMEEREKTPEVGRPDAIFVDVSGMGWGVYDRLMQLNCPGVYPVNFGDAGGMASFNGIEVKASLLVDRIWIEMREWLRVGAIPDDEGLHNELIAREYGYTNDSTIKLEQKDHMKARKLPSPDRADALALTFTWPVAPRLIHDIERPGFQNPRTGVTRDHDPYADVNR